MMDKEQAEYRFNIMKEGLTILTEESDERRRQKYIDRGFTKLILK